MGKSLGLNLAVFQHSVENERRRVRVVVVREIVDSGDVTGRTGVGRVELGDESDLDTSNHVLITESSEFCVIGHVVKLELLGSEDVSDTGGLDGGLENLPMPTMHRT